MRLAQSPWLNHSWHVTLYLSARGLRTSPIPHQGGSFEIELDFAAHQLVIKCSSGQSGGFALQPQSVAAFHGKLAAGFASAPVQPGEAFYSSELREFILPCDAVREAASPDAMLLAFLQSTYQAAADLARWNRPMLERS